MCIIIRTRISTWSSLEHCYLNTTTKTFSDRDLEPVLDGCSAQNRRGQQRQPYFQRKSTDTDGCVSARVNFELVKHFFKALNGFWLLSTICVLLTDGYPVQGLVISQVISQRCSHSSHNMFSVRVAGNGGQLALSSSLLA